MTSRQTVALVRGEGRYESVTAALESIADQVRLNRVRRVLIKPNFVSTDCQLAAAHIDAVRAVQGFIRERYDGSISHISTSVGLASGWCRAIPRLGAAHGETSIELCFSLVIAPLQVKALRRGLFGVANELDRVGTITA